eukprot:scaffold1051_cov119-Cylindrotheca_fusiformis.AAC.12
MSPEEPTLRRKENCLRARPCLHPGKELGVPFESVQVKGKETVHGFPSHDTFVESTSGQAVSALCDHPRPCTMNDESNKPILHFEFMKLLYHGQ